MTRKEFDGYLKALQAHDYDGFTSYYTDDFKAHVNPPVKPGGGPLDKAGTIEMERTLAERWNWKMDVHQVVIGDDGVAVRGTLRGPLLKDWPISPSNTAKAGDQFAAGFISIYKLRGNKIAELWVASTG
jgi:hypothetical protein